MKKILVLVAGLMLAMASAFADWEDDNVSDFVFLTGGTNCNLSYIFRFRKNYKVDVQRTVMHEGHVMFMDVNTYEYNYSTIDDNEGTPQGAKWGVPSADYAIMKFGEGDRAILLVNTGMDGKIEVVRLAGERVELSGNSVRIKNYTE